MNEIKKNMNKQKNEFLCCLSLVNLPDLILLCFVLLQDAILLWMYDPATRDAVIVKEAIYGQTVTLRAATEVICSRTPSQIQHFKQVYLAMFHSPLERDIQNSATGDHLKVLLFLSCSSVSDDIVLFLGFKPALSVVYEMSTEV